MDFYHQPVMLSETLELLEPRPGGRYADLTSGGGGHLGALLEAVGPGAEVLGLDRDPEAIGHLSRTLAPKWPNLVLRRANFSRLDEVMADLGWEGIDGMVMDLGLSSQQMDRSGRGFSFNADEPLDMRMDPEEETTAADLVNLLTEKEIADLLYELGEERASRRLARAIVWARDKAPIRSSRQLADIVRRSLRKSGRRPAIDPATRTFMALRIAVNRELDHLKRLLILAPRLLNPGGRLAAISFHSLEDRLVKQNLVRRETEDTEKPYVKALNKKPLRPTPEEARSNPRARSAKLRGGQRVG
jgi:16S rRNA (cytosine1402-N4)-methyltransferase